MPFFPNIDDNRTRRNARRILSGYKRWKRVAADSSEQRITSSYRFEPRDKNYQPAKAVERLAISKVDAESELDAIEQAISAIDNEMYRYILTSKYIQRQSLTNIQIADNLGYAKTRYTELQGYALLAFAEAYRGGELLTLG